MTDSNVAVTTRVVDAFIDATFPWLPKPTILESADPNDAREHATATAIYVPRYSDAWNDGRADVAIHETFHVLAFWLGTHGVPVLEQWLAAIGADAALIRLVLINEVFAEHGARAYVDGYTGANYPQLVGVVPFDAPKMRAFIASLQAPSVPAGGQVAPVAIKTPAGPTASATVGGSMKGVDYANARGVFFLNAVKQSGYDFVVRYLDGGRVAGKQLTIDERDRILQAGLGVFLVWETTGAGPWTRDQGRADAQEAITAANALGYPDGAPIFYAVDEGVGPDDVVEYFNGVDELHYVVPSDPLRYNSLNPSHFETGAYGDYAICDAAATVPWKGVPWRWQTAAWSAGRRSDGAQLYQSDNGVVVAGAQVDIDQLAAGVALPAWKWNVTSVPAPDAFWARPDATPLSLGDLREYARRLQKQLDDTYARKTA